MIKFAGIFAILVVSTKHVSAQTQAVSLCPLYLVLQNRCPTPTTTIGTSTARTTTVSNQNGNGTDSSSESDPVDSCGLPTINICPATQQFVDGGSTCSDGQTIQIGLTTLAQLLVNPSMDKAARTVGSSSVEALGNTFNSISKSVQASPSQATVGVTFIPVGQIISG